MVLGGEDIPARYIANWLLQWPTDTLPTTYHSEKHHTDIDMIDCFSFLTAETKREDHIAKEIYTEHIEGLKLIAQGVGLWSDNIALQSMQQYVRDNFIAFPSNNQLTERWVKDSNECTYRSKDEFYSNIYAITRSCTVMEFNDDAQIELRNRERRANKHVFLNML